LQLAGRAVEQRLNADHSDAGSSVLLCACGETARYVGRRAKTFASVLGPLRLERAYFHCARCGHGFCLRDRQLGLDNTVLSPAVTQRDGAAKTREVKLCTVWSAEGRDENDTPIRDPGSVTYSAAIETAAALDTDKQRSPFTERVLREAARRRFTEAACTVVIGDGALWIWNIAHELFSRAIQIVDRFHVKEHLSNLSKILYGNKPQQAKAWAKRRHEELDSGRLPHLLRALRRHADRCDDARQLLSIHPRQS
jgi:hypothetical protein